MPETDISILSIPEELRKRAGELAAERLRQDGKMAGTNFEEWKYLRYNIAHELLNA